MKNNQWWYVEDLIAGLDAPPTVKYLLERIRRHTNTRRGYAWASQKTLAWEMGVDESTAKRVFRRAKNMGVLRVRRIRTGKLPDQQHNEYCLDIDRMMEMQREHPTPVSHDEVEQGAPAPLDIGRTRGKSYLNKGQIALRTGGTSAPIGSEVKQGPNKAGTKKPFKPSSFEVEAKSKIKTETQTETDFVISPSAVQNLRSIARDRGFGAADLRKFVRQNFRATSIARLTYAQLHECLDLIRQSSYIQ